MDWAVVGVISLVFLGTGLWLVWRFKKVMKLYGVAPLIFVALLWWPTWVNVGVLWDYCSKEYVSNSIEQVSEYLVFSPNPAEAEKKYSVHRMPSFKSPGGDETWYARGVRLQLLLQNVSLASEPSISSISILLTGYDNSQVDEITYEWPPPDTAYDPWGGGAEEPEELTFVVFVACMKDRQWLGLYQWYPKGVLEHPKYEDHYGIFTPLTPNGKDALELVLSDKRIFSTPEEYLLAKDSPKAVFGKILVQDPGVYHFKGKATFEIDSIDNRLKGPIGWLMRHIPPQRPKEIRLFVTETHVTVAANQFMERQKECQAANAVSQYVTEDISAEQDKEKVDIKFDSLIVFPISDVLAAQVPESNLDEDILRAICLKPKVLPSGDPIPIILVGNNPALYGPWPPFSDPELKAIWLTISSKSLFEATRIFPVNPDERWSFKGFARWPSKPLDPATDLLIRQRLQRLRAIP